MVFSKAQSGFQQGKNIFMNILYFKAIKDKAINLGQDLYVLFVDLRKAFDTLDRKVVYAALKTMGFPEAWVSWIQKLSESIVTEVRQGKRGIARIFLESGFPQGGPLSPDLFNVAVKLLILELNETSKKWKGF